MPLERAWPDPPTGPVSSSVSHLIYTVSSVPIVHVADRLTSLATELASVLAAPADDVIAREWVAVPSAGMRRWLQLELAAHLGASGPDRAYWTMNPE